MEHEDEVLEALRHIVDSAEQSDKYQEAKAGEEFLRGIMIAFKLPRRQALLVARQIRVQYKYNAKRQGMSTEEYAEALSDRNVMSIVGFCVGAVAQADFDHHRDPETGEDIGPEYSI